MDKANPSPQTVIAVFASLPEAAHDARKFTTLVLNSWGLSDLADTATVPVSELITNAVQHAGGIINPPADRTKLRGQVPPVALVLSRLGPCLRVGVWDTSQMPPQRCEASDDAESGRGLDLLDALSKEWGYEFLTVGKTVWAAFEAGCV